MVPNLITFVLLACACVTINAKLRLVTLNKACMKIRKGSPTGFERHMLPIILPQVKDDWEMPLPECFGETLGVDVEACDDDKIPAVKFTNSSTVVVHRTSHLDSFIVVRINLYCLSPQDELSSGKIPPPLLNI